jgi:PAS domain S-box-containing protein
MPSEPIDPDGARFLSSRGDDTDAGSGRAEDTTLLRKAVDQLGDIFFVFDDDLQFQTWNKTATKVTGYDGDEVTEMTPTEFVVPEDRPAVAKAISRAFEEGRSTVEATLLTADGERVPYELTGAVLGDVADPSGIVGIGRNISDRLEREHRLQEQAERLERLDRINRVIRSTLQDLTAARTREEAEEAVVGRLVDADPYRFAWIGEFDRGDEVVARAWAGDGADYLEDRKDVRFDAGDVTAGDAIRDDSVSVVQRVAENPAAEAWRDVALGHGFESGAAIPLSNRGSTLGVLCVYADEPDAFDAEEQTVLRELGETIAHAITAIERRRALIADVSVELELAVHDRDLFPVALSAAVPDARVELVGGVPDGEEIRQFYRVKDADRETALTVARETGTSAAFVRQDEQDFIVRVTDPADVAGVLAERGGRIAGGYAEDGEGRLVVQVPPQVDVRSLVDSLEEYDIQLVARRERPSESDPKNGGRLGALTERQRTVLETAYHAGYFDSPRENTGAEVAESLDIATPTFHEHIRAAVRKLVGENVDRDRPTDED